MRETLGWKVESAGAFEPTPGRRLFALLLLLELFVGAVLEALVL